MQLRSEPGELAFKAGWQSLAANRFAEAVEFMERAIRQDGTENANRQVTMPDGTAAPYLPHHFMAVALVHLGDCDGAFRAWEQSLRQDEVQRTTEMERLISLRQTCAARLPHAAAPPDDPRDVAESEERFRAEAELGAATAAARRAEQSPAVIAARRRDADFARQWQRTETVLAEARRGFAAALAADDIAALDRVREQSALAQESFAELLSRANASAAESTRPPPRPETAAEPQTTTGAEPLPSAPATTGAEPRPSPPAPDPVRAPSAGAPPPEPEPDTALAATPTLPFQWVLLGTGVALLASVLGLAVLVPQPTPFQYVAFRTTLSLAATCVAASIPWLMSMSGDVQRAGSIGGALAVFVIVYFLDPIGRGQPEPGGAAGGAALPAIPEAGIFLCYRRTDSEDVVGRLHAALVATFGDEAVFKDVDDVTLGIDYRKVLKEAVGRCRVILAVVGPEWEAVRDDSGRRRIEDPDDWVRIEIASALQRDIPVIPVLIRRQQWPPTTRLPADLRDLAYRQAIHLRPDPDFDNDVARLVANLHRLLDIAPSRT